MATTKTTARRLAYLEKRAQRSDYWKGAELYYRCLRERQDNLSGAAFFYRYGYQFLGLAFSVYIHRLIEQLAALEIDHALFIAREGYLFKKIYDLMLANWPSPLLHQTSTSYACLSRNSTFLASARQLTTREIVMGTAKPEQKGLWSVLKTLGLPPEEFVDLARSHGLCIDQPIKNYWEDDRISRFLGDSQVQEIVSDHHQIAYHKLKQYLAQCQFWGSHRKVALIDIGWEGTIQDNLVRAYSNLSDFPLLYGLYFGRREHKPFLRYSASLSYGLIFDSRSKDINEESIDTFVEIFEQGARAPHPSTVGYAETETVVIPVFKDKQHQSRQHELAINPTLAVIQQGILDFAQVYIQQLQNNSMTAQTIKPFLLTLLTRHINFPTREEANQIITQIESHAEDLGEDNHISIGLNPHDFFAQLWSGNQLWSGKLKTLAKAFKAICWKQGSLRRLSLPGVLFLYVLRRFLVFGE